LHINNKKTNAFRGLNKIIDSLKTFLHINSLCTEWLVHFLKMALKRHAIMRQDSSASMDDYCLDRLFDPEELYYTPMDELLKRYKTRNLRPGRMFNMAKRYGHIQELRKRNILAPLTDIYEAYGDGIVKPQKLTCSPLVI